MISPASRFDRIEISLIRQINALATPSAINLGIGEPNVEPDEALREMAVRAARSGSWHYSPNAGTMALRTLVSESRGGTADPATEVCITAGTEEALFAVVTAFVESGDEVLVPDPGFLSYPTLVRLAGGTPVSYPLEPPDWSVDVEALSKRITPKTKAVIINSPSNPTGGIASAEALDALASLADERGILLVSDEVYREIHFGQRPATLLGLSPNAIVVDGLSKSHAMTGLRVGWVMAGEELMKTIVKAHQYIATCASTFSQTLAEIVLQEAEWNAKWLEKVRAQFRAQRGAALEAIETQLSIAVAPPAGAFYLFTPMPICDSLQLARALAIEADVLAIPGAAFGRLGEGHLRISFASPPEAIAEGIARIGRYLERKGR